MLDLLKVEKKKLIPFLITSIIITQVRSSFTWAYSPIIAFTLVLTLFFVIFYSKETKVTFTKPVLFTLYLTGTIFIFLNFQFSSFITLICFFVSIQLSDIEKESALRLLTKVFSVLIGVSLLAWLIHFNDIYVFQLWGLLDLSIIGNPGNLENYLFFVHNPATVFPRFYSIYEEPGALGVLLSFLLFANKFNLKTWENRILLLGLVFTYSLAGYLVSFVGFVVLRFSKPKQLFILAISTLILFFSFYLLLKDVEVFQMLIFDRLFDFDKHGIDSRNSADLNTFFSQYIYSIQSLWGMGEGYAGKSFAGASFKFFLIDYGWLGIISLLSIYISIGSKYKTVGLTALVPYALAFIPQGGAFIAWQILLYSITCSSLKNNYSKLNL